jgi:cytochrome c553
MGTERGGSIDCRGTSRVAVLLSLAIATPALADGIGNEHAPPQEICGTCHGLDGISRMAKFPKLAGQRPDYLERQIRDFREGRRSNDGGQMAAIVTEISEEQIAEVASHFASQPVPAPQAVLVDVSAKDRGGRLFRVGDPQAGIEPCQSCHTSGVRPPGSAASRAPLLGAQHEGYIAKQLADFRAGRRDNDAGREMRTIAARLSDADIAALARFVSAMPREAAAYD